MDILKVKSIVSESARNRAFELMWPMALWLHDMYTDCYMNVRTYLNERRNEIKSNLEMDELDVFINNNWVFSKDNENYDENDEDSEEEISLDRVNLQSEEVQNALIKIFDFLN